MGKSIQIPTLLPTSNRYVKLIPPFAWCWRHYWPEHDPRDLLMIHYDTVPELDDNSAPWYRMQMGKQADISWSRGIMTALSAWHAESVILLVLEDYWLDRAANHAAITHAITLMRDNPRIGKIDLSGDRLNFPHTEWPDHPDYVRAETRHTTWSPSGGFRSKLYLMSYQAALWRVGFLLDHMKATETPWESEERGNIRLLDTGMIILGHRGSPLHYTQAVKAGKPDLLRTERFDPHFLLYLASKGLLKHWDQ